jgi:hypothetical protein
LKGKERAEGRAAGWRGALFESLDVRLAPLEGALAHIDHLWLPEEPSGLLERKGGGDHVLELLGRVLLPQVSEHTLEAARGRAQGAARPGRWVERPSRGKIEPECGWKGKDEEEGGNSLGDKR